MNLYEITQMINELDQAFDNGEISAQTVKDTIEANGGDVYQKVENIIKYIKNLDAEKTALKAEADHLKTRATTCDNKITSLKEYLKSYMEYSQTPKIEAGLFVASLAKSPPSVDVLDEKKIPKEYWIEQEPKLDKRGLLADLKEGIEVEGALIKTGTSLRIK